MLGGKIMKALKIFLIISVVILAVVYAAAPLLSRLGIQALGTAYDLDIKFAALKKIGLGGMTFSELAITDKSRGIGILAKDALIRFKWNGPDPRNATVGFDLHGVRFVKSLREGASNYDTLDGLVAMPFSSAMIYDEIRADIRSSKGDVTISDFIAKSAMVKLSFNGTIRRDNTINSDIVIYFSDDLTKKIPPELTKLALTQEDAGWKSLSVKLQGNYTMPTIQLSSKLFRLKIGVKEGS
jgi:hypothetical protein